MTTTTNPSAPPIVSRTCRSILEEANDLIRDGNDPVSALEFAAGGCEQVRRQGEYFLVTALSYAGGDVYIPNAFAVSLENRQWVQGWI